MRDIPPHEVARAGPVSIIGSGNVGANTAFFIAEKGVTDVVLCDIQPGLSKGKALDIMEAAPVRRYRNSLRGADTLEGIRGSQMVVVAAGAIRKPGQRREDLFAANAPLVRELAPQVAQLAPDAVIVVATEPVDSLTALFTTESHLPRTRVVGLGGILDSTRFRAVIARELGLSMETVTAMVIGRHSNDMICLPRYSSVAGVPLPLLIPAARLQVLVDETRGAGDLVVELAKRASAYYGPSAAVAEVADSVHMNLNRIFSLSILLDGEYGLHGAALSLPVVVGDKGVTRILEPQLTAEETEALKRSAQKIRAALEGGA